MSEDLGRDGQLSDSHGRESARDDERKKDTNTHIVYNLESRMLTESSEFETQKGTKARSEGRSVRSVISFEHGADDYSMKRIASDDVAEEIATKKFKKEKEIGKTCIPFHWCLSDEFLLGSQHVPVPVTFELWINEILPRLDKASLCCLSLTCTAYMEVYFNPHDHARRFPYLCVINGHANLLAFCIKEWGFKRNCSKFVRAFLDKLPRDNFDMIPFLHHYFRRGNYGAELDRALIITPCLTHAARVIVTKSPLEFDAIFASQFMTLLRQHAEDNSIELYYFMESLILAGAVKFLKVLLHKEQERDRQRMLKNVNREPNQWLFRFNLHKKDFLLRFDLAAISLDEVRSIVRWYGNYKSNDDELNWSIYALLTATFWARPKRDPALCQYIADFTRKKHWNTIPPSFKVGLLTRFDPNRWSRDALIVLIDNVHLFGLSLLELLKVILSHAIHGNNPENLLLLTEYIGQIPIEEVTVEIRNSYQFRRLKSVDDHTELSKNSNRCYKLLSSSSKFSLVAEWPLDEEKEGICIQQLLFAGDKASIQHLLENHAKISPNCLTEFFLAGLNLKEHYHVPATIADIQTIGALILEVPMVNVPIAHPDRTKLMTDAIEHDRPLPFVFKTPGSEGCLFELLDRPGVIETVEWLKNEKGFTVNSLFPTNDAQRIEFTDRIKAAISFLLFVPESIKFFTFLDGVFDYKFFSYLSSADFRLIWLSFLDRDAGTDTFKQFTKGSLQEVLTSLRFILPKTSWEVKWLPEWTSYVTLPKHNLPARYFPPHIRDALNEFCTKSALGDFSEPKNADLRDVLKELRTKSALGDFSKPEKTPTADSIDS